MRCWPRLVSWSSAASTMAVLHLVGGVWAWEHQASQVMSRLPAFCLSSMQPVSAGVACAGVPPLPGLHLPRPEGGLPCSAWSAWYCRPIGSTSSLGRPAGMPPLVLHVFAEQTCRHDLIVLASLLGLCHVS